MNVRFICLGFTLFASALLTAGTLQDVELTDGSIVRAEVLSLDNGTYTLRSATLGEIEIPAAQIQSIARAQSAASAQGSTVQVDEIRNSLMNDPDAMRKIESLQNDPLVQDILNDQSTMRAISGGDINALMNDPKIKALLENSTVQELTRGASR